jgi:hypothetical protein
MLFGSIKMHPVTSALIPTPPETIIVVQMASGLPLLFSLMEIGLASAKP